MILYKAMNRLCLCTLPSRFLRTKTGCAGCRRVERKVKCEKHTHVWARKAIIISSTNHHVQQYLYLVRTAAATGCVPGTGTVLQKEAHPQPPIIITR